MDALWTSLEVAVARAGLKSRWFHVARETFDAVPTNGSAVFVFKDGDRKGEGLAGYKWVVEYLKHERSKSRKQRRQQRQQRRGKKRLRVDVDLTAAGADGNDGNDDEAPRGEPATAARDERAERRLRRHIGQFEDDVGDLLDERRDQARHEFLALYADVDRLVQEAVRDAVKRAFDVL